MNRKYAEMNLASIKVRNPIRANLGDLESLQSSIRQIGLLCPLVVDPHDVLISGSRRLEACRRAGLTTVPVWRLEAEYDSMDALEVCSAENLCREPLSAEDLERLIQSKKDAMSGRPGMVRAIIRWFRNLFRRRT
jgi:ParB family chromosome partitioning protein